ncbi:nondiscriminating glutamyl-tRNA synthetase EARS2, mitochondrial [Cherax quadricarinatus]|nr:probable glutamate--tRNA ligase, mitochondrial [Cherax quadricarinatus]XP_053653462.1 probable glutamate--tRNA ligase, mitochondrial [Cherax quadricarinatus]XP_053653470.1 probable glutamate--tRNA ligase, mitochondrial [Cherax quadricarinatus]XP_053653478.1 probable glutamate--tRNA ligase, mitochondrial [Cherax quadricarinatus]
MAKIFVTLHGMKSLLYKIQGAGHWKRHFASSLQKPCEVRARFAPSPTGNLHLGGLRTALYNFLFAKSNKGKFILRIEDTDQTRLVPHAARKLENMLSWAKIYPDESPVVGGPFGPYVQSQRLSLYNNYVKNLLENGSAYKCFCTNMRLTRLRNDAIRRNEIPRYDNKCRYLSQSKIEELGKNGTPYCIRFKLETITEPYEDLIYGSILSNVADHESDFVIMKTDGYPTYHLANVVDDHLMGITHVLRGVEWQISTPKHLLLYKAFGWSAPLFGHLPLIVNQDGSKLSKRQHDLHIEYYQDQGYFPEAVLNFVTDIGGGFDDREHGVVLSIEDLLEKFNLSRLTKNSCRLDKDKLEQFNQLDLQRRLNSPTDILLLISQLHDLVQKTYGERLSSSTTQAKVLTADYLKRVLIYFEKRIVRLQDLLQPEFAYIWVVPDSIPIEELPAMSCKHAEVLRCVLQVISSISNFNKERIVEEIKDVSRQYGLKIPAIMKLIRMTVTGMKEGPPVGEMLYMLGQDTAVERMKHALTLL